MCSVMSLPKAVNALGGRQPVPSDSQDISIYTLLRATILYIRYVNIQLSRPDLKT
jgi:hypothetical protein